MGVDGDSRAHVFEPTGRLVRSLRPARRAGSRNPQRMGLGAGPASYVLVTDGTSLAERERRVILQTVTIADASGDSRGRAGDGPAGESRRQPRRTAGRAPADGHGGPHTWSVFTPDGAWSAEVALPPRFVPFEFGRDYLAGVAFDDDDVERVVVWGLRR